MNLTYIFKSKTVTVAPNPNFDHRVKRNLHISFIEITHENVCFEK